MIDENATLFLYGRFHQGQPPINIENKTLVEQLDKIDLRKFFMNTRPRFQLKAFRLWTFGFLFNNVFIYINFLKLHDKEMLLRSI